VETDDELNDEDMILNHGDEFGLVDLFFDPDEKLKKKFGLTY